jgi:hypothetical protein
MNILNQKIRALVASLDCNDNQKLKTLDFYSQLPLDQSRPRGYPIP